MKRFLSLIVALALVTPVLAQNGDAAVDTLDELWSFQDAVPVDTGSVDLRFSFGWATGLAPGGTGDTFVVTPSLVWGCCDNVELSIGVPVWVGDGGDRYVFDDGNADTNLGVLWQFAQQGDDGPYDVALGGNFRIPTGCESNGVDYELRLAMTHSYESGVRSHFNIWGKVANGDNNKTFVNNQNFTLVNLFNIASNADDERGFRYGTVIGVDYPLCADGAVRLIVDYVHQSSFLEGQNNWNLAEVGWEWDMNDSDRLGMSFQFNLDRSNEAANAGAILTYAHALTF